MLQLISSLLALLFFLSGPAMKGNAEIWHSSIAAEGGSQFVYRELSAVDRARLDQGLGLLPKGKGGTIADQVRGAPTKYISASETTKGASYYASGNGLVAIDVGKAVQGGAGFVPHNNVMRTLLRTETGLPIDDARKAIEVMFKGEIPFNAIIPLKGF